jgi:hypothetical protein
MNDVNKMVNENPLVIRCREIAVRSEVDKMQEIIDCMTPIILMTREELKADSSPNGVNQIDFRLQCLIQMTKCMDILQQTIDGRAASSSSFSWNSPK